MALTITKVPDCKAALGFSQFDEAFMLTPGLSDYPTGGYNITNDALSLGLLYGAWKISANGAAALYDVNFVLPAYGATPAPQSSMKALVTSAGVQVAANTDLSACRWIIVARAAGE